ncbi:glutamate-rich protein 4 [Monodelphis domestica]|uniref:glutamate-rich protein 4 n=1 Tax=Monodelphis domestica TaxID=13616 RepID=UPI0004435041|nr:glutamate-rich protein 4 [Monodelphis domestica]
MEALGQLTMAGLAPLELGPPPRALRDPVGPCSWPETGAESLPSIDWVWDQLWSLRRMDILLFNQLCTLSLEIQALQEETEIDQDGEGGNLGASPPNWLIPDFEITL